MAEVMQKTLDKIHQRIELAKKRAGRHDTVLLLGVTKTQSVQRMNEAIRAGVTAIGENKAQELCEKYPDIDKGVDIQFIGHLQKNKVKYIIDKVSLIHSVDSPELMEEINKRAAAANKVQDILLEVNVSGEESKFGISPDQVFDLLEKAEDFKALRVRGLMTIAPKTDDPENSRKYFKSLKKLAVDIGLKNYHNITMDFLSMGMSSDFEVAVEEGANIVRIGSLLFGKRNN